MTPTKQEFFDTTVKALRAQGKQAIDPLSGLCCYRSTDGLKCAAGHHIPDELYSPAMEGRIIEVVLTVWPVLWSFFPNLGLAEALQHAHDHNDSWDNHGLSQEGLRKLRMVALDYDLSTAVLD